MKSCPKCGGLNPENSTVCGACGASLENVISEEKDTDKIELNTKKNKSEKESKPEETQIDEQELLNSYVVNNNYSLLYGGFSWCTLFFGMFYLGYRKMYKLMLIWIVIVFSLFIVFGYLELTIIAVITSLIVNIVMAYKFKDLYKKHIYEEIGIIKQMNPDKDQDELNDLCSQKGKPSFVPVIVDAIGTVIIIAIICLIMSIPFTSKIINMPKNILFSNNALSAVEAVKSDFSTNGFSDSSAGTCTNSTCTYSLKQINSLTNKKLKHSPYGVKYKEGIIKVSKNEFGDINYSMCLFDSKGNGFKLTSAELIKANVVEKNKKPYCK